MRMGFCSNCGRTVGHRRAFGVGTVIMCLITLGMWICVLPFYPKRCVACGARYFGRQATETTRERLVPAQAQAEGTAPTQATGGINWWYAVGAAIGRLPWWKRILYAYLVIGAFLTLRVLLTISPSTAPNVSMRQSTQETLVRTALSPDEAQRYLNTVSGFCGPSSYGTWGNEPALFLSVEEWRRADSVKLQAAMNARAGYLRWHVYVSDRGKTCDGACCVDREVLSK